MVGLVAWLAVAGALIVIDATAWPALMLAPRWETFGIFAGTLFAGSVGAASIMCVIDPKRKTPLIVQIAAVGFWILSLLGRAKRQANNPDEIDNSSPSSSSDDGAFEHMGRAWGVFAMILGLGAYGGGIALTNYLLHHPATTTTTTTTTTTATTAEKPVPPPSKPGTTAPAAKPALAAPRDIVDAKDLAQAISMAKPVMSDVRTGPSQGARLLLTYLTVSAHWKDVFVKPSETTLAQVEKDASTERGKRLCEVGTLARIEKIELDGKVLYSARLVTKEQDALEMIVVGDTGALVKRKSAKFCGVVTGVLEVGGKAATLAVGMFELPANK